MDGAHYLFARRQLYVDAPNSHCSSLSHFKKSEPLKEISREQAGHDQALKDLLIPQYFVAALASNTLRRGPLSAQSCRMSRCIAANEAIQEECDRRGNIIALLVP